LTLDMYFGGDVASAATLPEAFESYEKHLLNALSARLRRRLTEVAATGGDPATFGAPEQMADRMLAVVPVAHPWHEQIGPFYDTAGLTKLLGITRQAVADRVRRRRLLAVSTRDKRLLYPILQFDGPNVLAGLPDVLMAFTDTTVDGWAVAAWLTTPAAALGSRTPIDWVHAGEDPAPLHLLAADTAARWRR
jgi:hypothetical protein